ncbi:MAG: cytochrome b N-terminal domain-containing protein [Nitrospinota bacterium]
MKNRNFWERIKPRKLNYRHYFGGAALLLLLSQLITGLYMIFYYEPSLRETYKTVQYFNNETTLGAFTRNMHRYGAFFMGAAVFFHLWIGYLRRDYQGGRKWTWITGVALLLLVSGFLISGTILPWEWKGYWMMEMFNNWLQNIPIAGEKLYTFFMTTYTPTRNFVIHDIILPILTLILLLSHCLSRLRSRGYKYYFIRQIFAAAPLIAVIISLSIYYQIPSEAPEVIPFPMDGQYIPAPEWYFVTFLLPYWYFYPRDWSVYLFWIPFIFIVVLFILPYLNKRRSKAKLKTIPGKRLQMLRFSYIGIGVIVGSLLIVGLLWGSVKSPWMGCSSCHHSAMGARMGIPPVTYKDTIRNPLVYDKRWMMRHWYEPQVVW